MTLNEVLKKNYMAAYRKIWTKDKEYMRVILVTFWGDLHDLRVDREGPEIQLYKPTKADMVMNDWCALDLKRDDWDAYKAVLENGLDDGDYIDNEE